MYAYFVRLCQNYRFNSRHYYDASICDEERTYISNKKFKFNCTFLMRVCTLNENVVVLWVSHTYN